MLRSFGHLGTAFLFLLVLTVPAPAAKAQWISFSDDTGSRLNLQAFADDPSGNPYQDDDEKDVAVGDFDMDGDDDVVVVRKRPFSNAGARQDVLLMNEGGSLIDRTSSHAPGFISTLTDARDVFVGDFTGDGWLDLVIANTFNQQPSFYRNLGDDAGGNWLGFVDESSSRLPTIEIPADVPAVLFCAVWGGDVDGDGSLDIYLSNYQPDGTGTKDILLINDGSGFFTNESTTRLGNYGNVAFGTGAEIRDVDNDGDNDIIKISTLYSAPPFAVGEFILFNDGTGVFSGLRYETVPTNKPYMFTLGDLNNDGLLDFLNQGDEQDEVALVTAVVADSSVSFSTSQLSPSPRTSGFGGNTKLVDIDGDGDLDGAIGPIDTDIQNCGSSSDFALLQNPGDGLLFDPWAANDDQNIHTDPHDFDFLDLDGDGCMDIVMGLCTGWKVFVQSSCAASNQTVDVIRRNIRSGTQTGGDLSSLYTSDDDYLTVDGMATASGHLAIVNLWADSPIAQPSDLDLTLEIAVDASPIRFTVRLRNFTTGDFDVVDAFVGPTSDTVKAYMNLGSPADYIQPGSSLIMLQLQATSSSGSVPAGFELRIDQASYQVTP